MLYKDLNCSDLTKDYQLLTEDRRASGGANRDLLPSLVGDTCSLKRERRGGCLGYTSGAYSYVLIKLSFEGK